MKIISLYLIVMFSEKDVIKAVISLAVSITISTLLHRVVKMSHLMSKFVIPVLIFHVTFYLLHEYWSDIVQESKALEEGMSPQYLSYGHTNFDGAWDNIGQDDPDATQNFLPTDHPQYSELSVLRENEGNPQPFNASNVNVPYAYLSGTTGVGQGSDTEVEQPEAQAAPQNQACSVGGPTAGLCSQPNVYNPMNLVAATPSPAWAPQRAAAVQERLARGEYIPTTAML